MKSGPLRWRLQRRIQLWQHQQQVRRLAQEVARQAANASAADSRRRPVIFFNATARLGEFSQNAAFSLLTSWSLQLSGQPVMHFVCQAGMSHCVLASGRAIGSGQGVYQSPPCAACQRESRALFAKVPVHGFHFQADPKLQQAIAGLHLDELMDFTFPAPDTGMSESSADRGGQQEIPLGRLVLPSIRWAMRQHTLSDDEDTRYLYRQYVLSGFNIAVQFARLLEQVQPNAAVIFNGIMYPEAIARWVAQQRQVRVITHEVGFQRFSAFFTDGEATAYPMRIPETFELSEAQQAQLDRYLEQRFQGQFTMAGIRFWPEMRRLDPSLLEKAKRFRQLVPIFTNVVYDTSQVHANTLFPHMFAWLDLLLEVIRQHPETLFIIRAHPDELRPGTAKQSRESVEQWVKSQGVDRLENVVFINSQEYLSSYELIQRAKFVLVYNSSIGMEAALLGAAVVAGGKARYTQLPMVYFPTSVSDYRELVEQFLAADQVHVPPEFQRNARRFLYYQLYRVSLSFEAYLKEGARPGLVELRPFSWEALRPENSRTMQVLWEGIVGAGQEPSAHREFVYDTDA